MPDRVTRIAQVPNTGRHASDVAAAGGAAQGSPDEQVAQPDLEASESLLVVLRGVGAVMFLTTRRVIVARDGIERRPRSGVTAFTLPTIRHLRIELGSGPSGRIAVWTDTGHEAVSMFFDARSFDRAHELIDVARPLIAMQRRGPGARPVRPPSGPAGSGPDDPA